MNKSQVRQDMKMADLMCGSAQDHTQCQNARTSLVVVVCNKGISQVSDCKFVKKSSSNLQTVASV